MNPMKLLDDFLEKFSLVNIYRKPHRPSRIFSDLCKRNSRGILINRASVTPFEHDIMSRLLTEKAIEEKLTGWGDSFELFKIPQPKRKVVEKTDKDIVEEIINGGMEKKFDITFDKFLEVYQQMLDENPEKFI